MTDTEIEKTRLERLYDESRARFEGWAAMDAPHLPAAQSDAMQVKLARWQQRNFGGANDVQMALGCIEEIGETFEAVSLEGIIDGIGDLCVYLGQLFTSNRLAIGPALIAANEAHQDTVKTGNVDSIDGSAVYADVGDPPEEALFAAGNLAHTVLKREQKIRGMDVDDDFRRALFANAVLLIAAALDRLAEVHGADAVMEARGAAGMYLVVGERVAARDWKKDPKKGGES